MMQCPICHNETNENAKFCTSCGKQIPRCPTCGKVLTKRSRFCTSDGTPIPAEILALIPEENPAPAPAPQPEPPAAPVSACARCGNPAEPGQQYCAACRSAIEAMQGGAAAVVTPPVKTSRFCTRCGQPTEEGQSVCAACRAKAAPVKAEPVKKKKNGGKIVLLVLLIVLLLSLVGVLVYAIAEGDLLSPPSQSQQKGDRDDDDDNTDGDGEDPTDDTDAAGGAAAAGTEAPAVTEAPTIPCTGLVLEGGESIVELSEANQTYTLRILPTPTDTTDKISYGSSNASVATVDSSGKITAVGEGEAIIVATCGDQTMKISVVCIFEEDDPLAYFATNCASMYMSEADLEGFDKEMCRIARNAIYAHSGRKFNDKDLQAYYEQFDWYEPKYEPSSFDTNLLNDIQLSNLNMVMEYERARGYR